MARGEVSAADAELIARLGQRDLSVSPAQLERWRTAGLLPAHQRRWPGRGRGSVAVLHDATVEIAAALARHARQGRHLRRTVLAWYAEAGRPAMLGQPAVPEPPWPAVRAALLWAAGTSTAGRLLQLARTATREEDRDAFYAAAEHVLSRTRDPGPLPHPAELRRQITAPDGGASASGADGTHGTGRATKHAAVHLVAAAGMGAQEVGAELLTEALTAVLPAHADQLSDAARQAEADGTLQTWLAGGALDPLARLAAADEAQMAQARRTAGQLAGIGSLYLMHALLMPDTPALTALRTRIDTLGIGQLLTTTTALMIRPTGIPAVLASCLDPQVAALADTLANQTLTPGMLDRPGQPGGPQAFMHDWLTTLHTTAAHLDDPDHSPSDDDRPPAHGEHP